MQTLWTRPKGGALRDSCGTVEIGGNRVFEAPGSGKVEAVSTRETPLGHFEGVVSPSPPVDIKSMKDIEEVVDRWAGSVLFSPKLAAQFKAFRDRRGASPLNSSV